MKQEDQKEIFLKNEGDQYYLRHLNEVEDRDTIPHYVSYFNKYIKPNSKILEIGCCFGRNLNFFYKTKNCSCYGIDPSQKAIEEGQKLFPHLNLKVGTSDSLKFEDESFDFVLFGFCLYLVDRKFLPLSISEADRVLKNHGYLGITDFDSHIPHKRIYRHCKGIYSYKMDYSKPFLAFPHYTLAEKYSFSHTSDKFVEKVDERVANIVLFKDYTNAFIEEPDI